MKNKNVFIIGDSYSTFEGYIPEGYACFYMDGGRIVLANQRMNELSFAITGQDLQNAEAFWKVLSEGEVQPGVKRLSYGERPNFRLKDGDVWTFAYEELNGIHQLI